MKKQYSAPDFIIAMVNDEDSLTGSPISTATAQGDLSQVGSKLDWDSLFGA